MAKKKNRKKTGAQRIEQRNLLRPALIIGLGLLLMALAVYFALANRPGGSGTAGEDEPPQLAVDQEQIDFGQVKVNEPVTASFEIKNQGEGLLRFTGEPWIEVVAGC